MTDKQIIIDGIDVSGCCQYMPRHMEDYDIDTLDYCRYHFKPCKDVDVKYCYYKQLKRKQNELEELRQYHNKCCEEFKKEKQDLIDKYNQLSINFYNGDYCNTDHCSLLKAKEQEREELKNIMYKCPQCGEEYLSPIGASLYEENNKLKQTLTEIKEIVKKAYDEFGNDVYGISPKQILQKIS